eukprot:IDg1141t1
MWRPEYVSRQCKTKKCVCKPPSHPYVKQNAGSEASARRRTTLQAGYGRARRVRNDVLIMQ